jgi:hypothetical protein
MMDFDEVTEMVYSLMSEYLHGHEMPDDDDSDESRSFYEALWSCYCDLPERPMPRALVETSSGYRLRKSEEEIITDWIRPRARAAVAAWRKRQGGRLK